MEIKTIDELKKAYPDLCEQMVKTAVEAREKELKEELSKEWDASAKEIADGIKKQIEESQEYKDFKAGMEIHKATLVEIGKLVKPYIGEGADEDEGAEIEERLAALETDLKATKDENKSLKEQIEKEKKDTANKEAVKKRIEEVTAGKENAAMLVEELKGCLTVEEVDKKLPEREAFIKKLLTEQKGGDPNKGKGQVLNEDKQDAVDTANLDEEKKRQRRVAGLE